MYRINIEITVERLVKYRKGIKTLPKSLKTFWEGGEAPPKVPNIYLWVHAYFLENIVFWNSKDTISVYKYGRNSRMIKEREREIRPFSFWQAKYSSYTLPLKTFYMSSINGNRSRSRFQTEVKFLWTRVSPYFSYKFSAHQRTHSVLL